MKRVITVCLCLICYSFFSQTDTLSTKKHPYKKSMIYSAILPGAGQVRNALLSERRYKPAYWKVPLIFGAIGASSYFTYQNHSIQNEIKKEYNNRLNGNSHTAEWADYDSFGLISLQKQYLNNRDLFILLTLAIYGVQIIDAGVEAHFLRFDMSEDLSIRLQPFTNLTSAGIRLNFLFR